MFLQMTQFCSFLWMSNIPLFMASGPITSWQLDGETLEAVTHFIFLGSKTTADVTEAMKLKDFYSWEEKL